MSKIKLGISSCLLGEKVRYDGGHQRDSFITDTLGRYVELVPVCPEVECGLGVPREPMRLVGRPEAPRLLTVRTKRDLTERLLGWAERAGGGTGRRRIWTASSSRANPPAAAWPGSRSTTSRGTPAGTGVGLFARVFMERFPLVPVEDEGRLHDPELRENFIERIFFWQRWREFLGRQPDLGRLVAFHTRHKLQILAHSTEHYRQMGRLVARRPGAAPAGGPRRPTWPWPWRR